MTNPDKPCWHCGGSGVVYHETGPAGATFTVGEVCEHCKGPAQALLKAGMSPDMLRKIERTLSESEKLDKEDS